MDLLEAALGIVSNGMSLVQRLPEDRQTEEWMQASRRWLDEFVARTRGGEHRMEYAVLWENGQLSMFRNLMSAQAYIDHNLRRLQTGTLHELYQAFGDPEKARAVERNVSVWPQPPLPLGHWSTYFGPWHEPTPGCCGVAGDPSPAVA